MSYTQSGILRNYEYHCGEFWRPIGRNLTLGQDKEVSSESNFRLEQGNSVLLKAKQPEKRKI